MITKEAHLPYDRPILSKVSVMFMLFAFGISHLNMCSAIISLET